MTAWCWIQRKYSKQIVVVKLCYEAIISVFNFCFFSHTHHGWREMQKNWRSSDGRLSSQWELHPRKKEHRVPSRKFIVIVTPQDFLSYGVPWLKPLLFIVTALLACFYPFRLCLSCFHTSLSIAQRVFYSTKIQIFTSF